MNISEAMNHINNVKRISRTSIDSLKQSGFAISEKTHEITEPVKLDEKLTVHPPKGKLITAIKDLEKHEFIQKPGKKPEAFTSHLIFAGDVNVMHLKVFHSPDAPRKLMLTYYNPNNMNAAALAKLQNHYDVEAVGKNPLRESEIFDNGKLVARISSSGGFGDFEVMDERHTKKLLSCLLGENS